MATAGIPFSCWGKDELDKFEAMAAYTYDKANHEQNLAEESCKLLLKIPAPLRSHYAQIYSWPENTEDFVNAAEQCKK